MILNLTTSVFSLVLILVRLYVDINTTHVDVITTDNTKCWYYYYRILILITPYIDIMLILLLHNVDILHTNVKYVHIFTVHLGGMKSMLISSLGTIISTYILIRGLLKSTLFEVLGSITSMLRYILRTITSIFP